MKCLAKVLKKIRLVPGKGGRPAWQEQAAAWRLAQEQAIAKGSDTSTPKP